MPPLGSLEISTRVEGILGIGKREERKESREGGSSSSNGGTACARANKHEEGGRGLSSRYRGVEGRGGVTGGREKYYTCRYGAGC